MITKHSTHFNAVKIMKFLTILALPIVVLLTITDVLPISLRIDRVRPSIAQDSTVALRTVADEALKKGIQQYEANQIDAALKNLQKAISHYFQLGDTRSELMGHHYLGRAYLKNNNLEQAALTLLYEINQGDNIRKGLPETEKISFSDNQASTNRLLQEVLIRQNRIGPALEVAERGRARIFADLLDRRHSSIPKDKLEGAIVPNLNSLIRIAHLQKATLVQYSIMNENELYIWVISTDREDPESDLKIKGKVSFHQTKWDPKIPMVELLTYSRASIAIVGTSTSESKQIPPKELNQSLKEIYKVLIKPIANELPKDPNEKVIFIPQGELFMVPFAALQDPQGKYLIENHTISTAPSIQSLTFTRSLARKYHFGYQHHPRPALVVGNPTMPIVNNQPLSPLPGAEQEAIDVAKLLNTSPLLGAQATKSAILEQMPKARIIHFATHGLLDTIDQDIPGAIALAPNGKDTGILTAAELLNLNITPELVVLSACDTGRGTITGDGVMGLSRSLIASGVPSVIASLWAVSDQSTSVLMTHFYRNFQANPNKAQALRQAMLSTMKEYPNPSYWAAFTLIGESNYIPVGDATYALR